MSGDTLEENIERVQAYVIRAFRPGDVIVLRFTRPMPVEAYDRMVKLAQKFTEETGVKFVLLDESIEVVGREERPG
jgi:hypothetical protein